MNDEAAFLAAIAAAPDDQNLPLVFADWLEDHDDPRGRWIREWAVRPWMGKTFADPVPVILAALAKDRKVLEARRAAAAIGEPIVPGLIDLLKHATPRVREQACLCLRRIGPRARAAVPALMELLTDPNNYVRDKAAKAISDIGADESADTDRLKAALNDRNWSVRRAASRVLGAMGAKGGVLEELVEKYESPDSDDRAEVVEGLAQLGTVDVVPHLDKALDDRSAAVRLDAVKALGRLKHVGASAALCRAMAARDANVRETAVQQFASYSRYVPFTPEAVTAVTVLLGDKVVRVRTMACCALSRAGSPARAAVPVLIKLLADAEAEVRAAAANALGAVGHDEASAVAPLVDLLADTEPNVAGSAAGALGAWSALPPSVVPPLMTYIDRARVANTWQMTVASAFGALGRVASPPPAVLDMFRTAIGDWNNNDCWPALNALRALGPAAAPAIPELLALLRAEQVHGEVVNALVRIGGPAIDRLNEILDGEDDQPRLHIVQRMWDAREAGLPLLPALLRYYRRVPDDWKRCQVIHAIRALGAGATDAIPDLLNALETHGRYQSGSDAFHALLPFGPALVPHLTRFAELSRTEKFIEWRGTFTKLFADLAPHAPAALELLRESLRASIPVEGASWNGNWANREVRLQALRGLEYFREEAAVVVPEVAPLVGDPVEEVRRAAVRLIGSFGTPAALPPLYRALTDTDEAVRLGAAEELARQGDTSDATLVALVHAVEDRAPKVRRAAIDALGKLKAGTEAVLAALEAATGDDDKKVAERAAVALKKLAPKEPKAKPAKKPKIGAPAAKKKAT